jgi:hypothetical protein
MSEAEGGINLNSILIIAIVAVIAYVAYLIYKGGGALGAVASGLAGAGATGLVGATEYYAGEPLPAGQYEGVKKLGFPYEQGFTFMKNIAQGTGIGKPTQQKLKQVTPPISSLPKIQQQMRKAAFVAKATPGPVGKIQTNILYLMKKHIKK